MHCIKKAVPVLTGQRIRQIDQPEHTDVVVHHQDAREQYRARYRIQGQVGHAGDLPLNGGNFKFCRALRLGCIGHPNQE